MPASSVRLWPRSIHFLKSPGRGLPSFGPRESTSTWACWKIKLLELNAPYCKLVRRGRPWVIAKWAMTLDGKLATRSGDSRWISSEASRRVVHQLRGRVDAIVVGRRTAELDDPQLTARPAGPREAARIVLDSQATLSIDSNLVKTARELPVIVAVGSHADASRQQALRDAGCQVLCLSGEDHLERLGALLDELGKRRMTNVLVEGGGRLLGSLFDAGEIDEVHVFVAPKLIGGAEAVVPLGGCGISKMAEAMKLKGVAIECIESDIYIHGRLNGQGPGAAEIP